MSAVPSYVGALLREPTSFWDVSYNFYVQLTGDPEGVEESYHDMEADGCFGKIRCVEANTKASCTALLNKDGSVAGLEGVFRYGPVISRTVAAPKEGDIPKVSLNAPDIINASMVYKDGSVICFKRTWFNAIVPICCSTTIMRYGMFSPFKFHMHEPRQSPFARVFKEVKEHGKITINEPVLYPNMASYGMAYNCGSMDADCYFPRLTWSPTPLSSIEGRVGDLFGVRGDRKERLCDGVSRLTGYKPELERENFKSHPRGVFVGTMDSMKMVAVDQYKEELVKECTELGVPMFGTQVERIEAACIRQDSAWAMFYCEFYRLVNTMLTKAEMLFREEQGFYWGMRDGSMCLIREDLIVRDRRFSHMHSAVVEFIDNIIACTPSILRPVGAQHMFITLVRAMHSHFVEVLNMICARGSFLGGCSKTSSDVHLEPNRQDREYLAWHSVRDLIINLNTLYSDALAATLTVASVVKNDYAHQAGERGQRSPLFFSHEDIESAKLEDPMHWGQRLRIVHLQLSIGNTQASSEGEAKRGLLCMTYKPFPLDKIAIALSTRTCSPLRSFHPPSVIGQDPYYPGKVVDTPHLSLISKMSSFGKVGKSTLLNLFNRQRAEALHSGHSPLKVTTFDLFSDPGMSSVVLRLMRAGMEDQFGTRYFRNWGVNDLHHKEGEHAYDCLLPWPNRLSGNEIMQLGSLNTPAPYLRQTMSMLTGFDWNSKSQQFWNSGLLNRVAYWVSSHTFMPPTGILQSFIGEKVAVAVLKSAVDDDDKTDETPDLSWLDEIEPEQAPAAPKTKKKKKKAKKGKKKAAKPDRRKKEAEEERLAKLRQQEEEREKEMRRRVEEAIAKKKDDERAKKQMEAFVEAEKEKARREMEEKLEKEQVRIKFFDCLRSSVLPLISRHPHFEKRQALAFLRSTVLPRVLEGRELKRVVGDEEEDISTIAAEEEDAWTDDGTVDVNTDALSVPLNPKHFTPELDALLVQLAQAIDFVVVHMGPMDPFLQQSRSPSGVYPLGVLFNYPNVTALLDQIKPFMAPIHAMIEACRRSPFLESWTTGVKVVEMRLD
nr:hypothetical protein [Sicyoidochytrium minutum DNA virus]